MLEHHARPRVRDQGSAAVFGRALALAIGVFVVHALHAQSAAIPKFDVASVKIDKSNDRRPQAKFKAFPAAGRIVITGMSVLSVIQGAYGLQSFELVYNNNPVLGQGIDIEAKTDGKAASSAEMQRMLQPLLAERLGLVVHREAREMNAFVLTVAAKDGRLGPKMKKSDRGCDDLGTGPTVFVIAPPPLPGEQTPCGYPPSGVGRIVGVGLDLPTIIGLLSAVGRPIVDSTGLQGRYDIDVTYTPQPFSAEALVQRGAAPMPGVDPNGPSLLNAIQEQLGLKLQAKKMPIQVVVIDQIGSLTEN